MGQSSGLGPALFAEEKRLIDWLPPAALALLPELPAHFRNGARLRRRWLDALGDRRMTALNIEREQQLVPERPAFISTSRQPFPFPLGYGHKMRVWARTDGGVDS
jgi:hypothetical protein